MALSCVILAGGRGTRMRPHTDSVPKALLPVGGRPFADLQLAWLRGQGVEHVVFSVGHLGGMIREHVGDGSRFGLRIDYVDEGDDLRGTGGALRLVAASGLLGDAATVINGDSYLDLDLPAVEAAFARSGAAALMTVVRNRNRWDASNAVVRDGRVFLYDKTRPQQHRAAMEWIDYGLLVLRTELLLAAVPAGGYADIADTMRDLSRSGQFAAYEVSERFFEIGSPEGLADLEARLGAAR